MEVDIKQTNIDSIVRNLQKKSFEVTKSIAENKDYLELLKELEIDIKKLRNSQKPAHGKKTKDFDRRYYDWKPFLKWLKDNGFPNADDYEIVYNPDSGHGLTLKRDIKKNEIVLEIPTKLMMTNKTAIQSSKLALLLHNDQMLQEVYSLSLALHLLVEQRTLNSFWAPYINSLPRKVPNSPLFWTFEDMVKLRGTLALEELVKFKVSFVKAYCHVYFRLEKQLEMAIMKRSSFTYDSFGWAYSITYSRQNQIYVIGANNKPVRAFALIPLFDLLNHDTTLGAITTHYLLEKEALESRAARDYKKGEEIKIFYGERPNCELFVNSGFVVGDNPFNYTAIPFSLAEKDKFRERKIELLQKYSLPPSGKFSMEISRPIQDELLSFLRIAWINTEEDMKDAEKVFKDEPVSLQNDITVFSMLDLKLNQILSGFETTLEEDKKQIEMEKEKGNNKAIITLQLLIDEKSIFSTASKLAKTKKADLLKKKSNTNKS